MSCPASVNEGTAPGAARETIMVFKQALVHIARIARVLSMEQGHMILIGAAGSGRSTLCRLAAFVSNMQVLCL